ncbi:hypothetical protein [Microbacterium sulfonylureivorans]|uniref:hypothetical protein n=1 Tax=Microbacterium sulfonylureivorans TaxID=2486854 RepID=UPI00197B168A|nr:hypothetical protein [Microbacterium sulfonylureivorans]
MAADPPVGPAAGVSSPAPDPSESDAALGRRAQMLATEHWGLLAARSTAQSEVLTRITIFLTLVSAGLLTIGLLGQATKFDGWFAGAALAILGFLALIGLMTQMRVFNVAEEDLMYVIAMNRLRGAYVDLDPPIERYFLAATADDMLGSQRTYSFLRTRGFSHLFGSSFMLILVVNACVVGLFLGGAILAAGGLMGWAVIAGILAAVLLLVGFGRYGFWTYQEAWRIHRPLRTTPQAVTEPAATAPGLDTPALGAPGATGTRRGSRRRSARS